MQLNLSPRVKMKKFGLGALIIFLFVGILLIALGFKLFKDIKIDPNWTKINGQVIDYSVERSDGNNIYYPVVGYTVENSSYSIRSIVSDNKEPIKGSSKELAYNPNNPAEAKIVYGSGTLFTPAFVLIMGVLFTIISPVLFIKYRIRKNKINKLVQTGQKLQGVITGVDNGTPGTNNENFKVIVSATDSSGQTRSFKSDEISGIGTIAMMDFKNNPIPVDVYIDPVNPENYYVDISDLPSLTPERIVDLIKSVTKTVNSGEDSGIEQANETNAVSSDFNEQVKVPENNPNHINKI